MATKATTSIGPSGDGGNVNQGAPVRHDDNRAQAPIRWPKPDGPGVVLFLVWVVGVVTALGVPGLIVGPSQETAPTNDILLAAGLTAIGCLIMLVSSYVAYRRSGEIALVMLGGVPAFSCLAGGIILAATKLTATGTGVG